MEYLNARLAGGPDSRGPESSGGIQGFPNLDARPNLPAKSSGLESLQDIENALPASKSEQQPSEPFDY